MEVQHLKEMILFNLVLALNIDLKKTNFMLSLAECETSFLIKKVEIVLLYVLLKIIILLIKQIRCCQLVI